ncbi:MAG TPA: glycosyltransferase family 4 protein [Acidimicrobiales bacterium]|nr:glycosyltransferase family 4 protein [Acidimicrobiales bacterium]
MTKVLVVTADVLRSQMAGPAMRAWHMAAGLAAENDVQLLTTSPYCEVRAEGFSVAAAGPEQLAAAEAWSDVMVLQGYVTLHHAVLARSEKLIVFDVYDPLHLETLALTKGASGPAREWHVRTSLETLNFQLRRADFLMCASERQRDLYIGQLCALGRVNWLTYDGDPTLRDLIDVVPFGVPDDNPEHRHAVLRGVLPGTAPEDDILVWAGGVYDWFDPLTLVRAVARLASRRPSVRLYFMGMQHPNPDVPPMQMAIDVRALAHELGVAGRNVFFNDGWVEYAQRQDYLLEATLGVTMHFDSAETRFSFRTRALDYIWAALPMVTTEGDSFAQLVRDEGLGLCVPAQDVEALEAALERLLSDDELMASCRQAAAAARERFRWSAVLEPLLRFCKDPRRAPDVVLPIDLARVPAGPDDKAGLGATGEGTETPAGPPGEPAPRARSLLEVARHHYREGGLAQVAKLAASKAGRITRGDKGRAG